MTDQERRHQPIIVIGAERSGTSVVTDMIHRWGAFAGPPEKLAPANEHNPRGQWEFEPLWDLLAEIGDFAHGANWWSESFQSRVATKLDDPALVAKARALMAEMDEGGRPWVWKDPAFCHFLPFWQGIWGNVVYVVTVRHPFDVARSWQRVAMSGHQQSADFIACNLLRWQHMMLSVLRATEATARKGFVEFEELIAEPFGQARRLASFLDHQIRRTTSDETVASMASAIDPALHRHRFGRPLTEIPESMPPQHALYDFLRHKVAHPAAHFDDSFDMPEGWREYVRHNEARPV